MAKGINPATGRSTRFKDRVATRHGRLTFIRTAGLSVHRQVIWEAKCDCGAVVTTVRPSQTQSCGCLQRETAAAIQRAKALSLEERQQRSQINAVRQRARRKTHPLLAMQARLSRLHRHALAQIGAIKTSPTFEQLGYSVRQFVDHIERQFLPGMGWHNMRLWQLDHILPISGAETEADVIALNHITNLRPMWANDNNAKKDKRQSLL